MVFNKLWCLLLLLVVSACADHQAIKVDGAQQHRQVVVEGSAAIGSAGQAQARLQAIDNAVAEAAMQLRGSHFSGGDGVFDSKVVDEWLTGDVYHVQVLAVWSDKSGCVSHYRKKILATAFPAMTADQVSSSESQDLFAGIPREINNHLQESGDFIGRNLTSTVLYSRPDMAPEIIRDQNYSGSSVINLARQQDAQFVLSGVIRDFKIESGEYLRGSGLLSEIKSLVRDMVGRRSIGIDVFVHDGFSGALLFQHRYTDSIMGDISLPAGYNVGSERFHATPAGYKIDTIVQQASKDIEQFLSCFPFASRVSEVNGNQIVIAAGAQDKVKVGDQFKVYSARPNATGTSVSIGVFQGVLSISDVSTNSAIGHLEGDAQPWMIRAGDWVKTANSQ